MGRRRKTNVIEDLISIAAALPWWASLVLAAISFGILRFAAHSPVPTPAGPGDMRAVIVRQVLVTGAGLGQFIVPTAFLVGMALSAFRKARAARLVDAFAGAPAGNTVAGPHQSPTMTWREFETLVAEIYRRQGFQVAETNRGPDGGVDLVLRRGNDEYFVQCKHWQARLVSVNVVRELKGVIAQAGVTGGAVVTSGRFTADAVAFAQQACVELLDGERLLRLAKELRHREEADRARREPVMPDVFSDPPPSLDPCCPRCGSIMVLRQAKRGPNAGQYFWGCELFPQCRGTVSAGGEARTRAPRRRQDGNGAISGESRAMGDG